jgi:hypothetical protein
MPRTVRTPARTGEQKEFVRLNSFVNYFILIITKLFTFLQSSDSSI